MRTAAAEHPQVAEFRRRLQTAVRRLPRSQSEQLLEQIDSHLEEAISPASTEADIRAVLDRLGNPEGIAQAAAPGQEGTPGTPYREISALILLTVGSVLLPLVGWLAGVFLLWTSSRWHLREKLLGTLIWPGGLGAVVFLAAGRVGGTSGCESGFNARGQVISQHCFHTDRPSGWVRQPPSSC